MRWVSDTAIHRTRDRGCAHRTGVRGRHRSRATGSGGYEKRSPNAYDETLALFPTDVTGFLKESQPARWQAPEVLFGPKTAATVLEGLPKRPDGFRPPRRQDSACGGAGR